MKNNFNIRVYGICIKDGSVLVNHELIQGVMISKFPGGGLERGEGLKDCLMREWEEELGVDIEVLEHFYTTDFYVKSAFDDSQVISIYYLVKMLGDGTFENKEPNEESLWILAEGIAEDSFTLPIDKLVGGMIRQAFIKRAL